MRIFGISFTLIVLLVIAYWLGTQGAVNRVIGMVTGGQA